jgi:hypothetical protein
MGTKSLSLYKRLVVYVQPGFGVDLVMERIHFVAFMAVHVKNKAANEGNGLPSRPGAAEFGIKRRRRPFDVSLLSSIAPWSIRRRMTFMIAFSIAPSNLRFDLKKIASIYNVSPQIAQLPPNTRPPHHTAPPNGIDTTRLPNLPTSDRIIPRIIRTAPIRLSPFLHSPSLSFHIAEPRRTNLIHKTTLAQSTSPKSRHIRPS